MSTSAASEVSLDDVNLLESGGIVAFVTPGGLGFSGKVKSFPEDFCVNEILSDGTLVTVEEGDDTDQVVDFTFPEPSAAAAAADQNGSDAGGIEGGDCGGGMSSRGGVGVDDSSHAVGGGPARDSAKSKEGGDNNSHSTLAAAKEQTVAAPAAHAATVGAALLASSVDPLPLEELFPADTRKTLEDFARSQEESPPSEGQKDRPSVRLAFPPSMIEAKEGRSACHRAIKAIYPYFKTRTVRSETQGQKDEILVHSDEAYDAIRSILNKDDLLNLQRYVLETAGQAEGAVGWNGPSVSVAHGADRATRTSVHQCISRCLPFLKAMTDDGRGRGGEQCIRIFRKPSRAEQNNSKKRKRNALGGGEKDVVVWYTAFYIKKSRVENLACITALSKALGVSPGHVSQHGTKDKIGITCQRMAVREVMPDALRGVRLPGVTIGKIEKVALSQPLRLGDLRGNRFKIRVRGINANKEEVMSRVDSLKDRGFINYFGTQRVGEWNAEGQVSHRIGEAIARGDYKAAVKMLLRSQGENRARLKQVMDVFESSAMERNDFKRVLKDLPGGCTVQNLILRSLQRNGKDAYLQSIQAVPYNSRTMYLESFQSYVWNCVASKRLVMLGNAPAVGDLVSTGQGSKEVRVLGQHDLEETGRGISIYDVVLPLPGRAVIYPTNQAGEWYKEELEKAGVDIADPCKRMPDFSGQFSGCYRNLLQRATSLEAKCLGGDDEDGGQGWDLELSFDLSKGCYATCALWELMKSTPLVDDR